MDDLRHQQVLIESLRAVLRETSGRVQLFETHISWVLVAGNLAYKFKKAVRFDFLDFSTLDARHFYCDEELRLNRRLAPSLYLDVAHITGSPQHPVIAGTGEPVEYAIRMRAFEQQALWTSRLTNRLLSSGEVDALAIKLAQFHQSAAVAPKESPWGTPDSLHALADGNLQQLADLLKSAQQNKLLDEIRSWHMAQGVKMRSLFERRKAQGFIRECHGDLHSGNILTIGNQVEIFDCIEFSDSLRWTDVMNDAAFVCMDLQFHGRRDLAARFLNSYLEATGDYEGLAVLDYYRAHRALVRGKVALLRAQQLCAGSKDARDAERQAKDYLVLARDGIQSALPVLMITHGFAGSGKSTLSRYVVELLGAVQLRSDVERKRLHRVAMNCRDTAALYEPASTESTYRRLAALAGIVAASGRPVIVDAAFLKIEQRKAFAHLATGLGMPFFIFDVSATQATMRDRIVLRGQHGRDPSDAGLAVLAHQLANHDPLTGEEMPRVISVDFEPEANPQAIQTLCAPVLQAIRDEANRAARRIRAQADKNAGKNN